MNDPIGPIDVYQPRHVEHLGRWKTAGPLFKIYGLLADGRTIDEPMTALARQVVDQQVLPRVKMQGQSNDLGFVIIHPGTLGLTVSSHWWCQGSVLGQYNYRTLYGAAAPPDAGTAHTVGCVWELALIHAEQEAWRRTMMTQAPSPQAYLQARAALDVV